ncbi:hypothetical protein [Larkinella soli]|uniref:hypothetical protein n=1 Tax=Larkinella soli TaxID=1770527 RepID=UPI000FFB53AE|nr:hypothetical protein [Larkinella soli]
MESVLQMLSTDSSMQSLNFPQWSHQVQELFDLYHALLVTQDKARTAEEAESLEKGRQHLLEELVALFTGLQSAPPQEDQTALHDYLEQYYVRLREEELYIRELLRQVSGTTTPGFRAFG